ncbi:transcription elongation factor [Zhouia sp. PK063]|uniref:transcription elongation factor n=1 Tax=Zhouia sp. PK063 TaxID=3373602 RepID=UPI0037B97532
MTKEDIYHKCLDILNKRIEKYNAEIAYIKESIENNDKTGDDEEGSNSGNFDDAYTKQLQYLEEASKMKNQLKQIDIFQSNDEVKIGSVVKASNGYFFLSIPLGKVDVEGTAIFAISKEAPVGQLLLHKKVGEKITFNNNSFEILEIL